MQQVETLLNMDTEQIEVEILKNLHLSSNGRNFVYKLPECNTTIDNNSDFEREKALDLPEVFPEEIQTSIYMSQTNTDYRVVLRMPSIEY